MRYTLDALIAKVQRDLGPSFKAVGTDYILEGMTEAFNEMCRKHNFSFWLKTAQFPIYASEDSVCLTGGSLAVPWVTTAISANLDDDGYVKVYVPTEQTHHIVTGFDVTKTKLTLDNAIVMPTSTGVYADLIGETFTVYRDEYSLPADCDYNKEIIIYDPQQQRCLTKIAEPTATETLRFNYYDSGEPEAYMPISKSYSTAAGAAADRALRWIQIWPRLLDTTKYLTISYFKNPHTAWSTFLSNSTYVVDLPDAYTEILYYKAMHLAYMKLRDPLAGYYDGKYKEILKDMINDNDGDAAMKRIAMEYPGWQGIAFDPLNVEVVE